MKIRILESICLFLALMAPIGSIYSADKKLSYEVTPERELFVAMMESDLNRFKELIAAGADPLKQTSKRHRFTSSVMCQATKPQHKEFFEFLLSHKEIDIGFLHDPRYADRRGSALGCAIDNENIEAFDQIIEWGVDINGVVNPEAKNEKSFQTPLFLALATRKFKISFHILNLVTPNDREIKTMIRVLEANAGIEGQPEQVYRRKLVDWLRSNGHEVNPGSPAPAELYEGRNVKGPNRPR